MKTTDAAPRCPVCSAPLPPGASAAGGCPACLLGAVAGPLGAPPSGAAGASATSGTAAPDTAPPPLPPGGLPGLELLEEIGRGGMGVVYRARQTTLDRVVAVKILSADLTRDPRFVERFAREAAAMARLSHPHLLAVHDFGEAGGVYFIVMEYVDGTNLRDVMRAGRIAPAEALAVVSQICGAVQYAHAAGVVHRDLKPENVLLDRSGRVRVADFGLAKLAGRAEPAGALTDPRSVMGTPHYMAPEQVERPATVDHRADIYSLGVVFYELLTGELPLGRFDPPSHRVQIDVRLDDVVLRALEKAPERRYQRADDLRTEVERVRTSSGGASPAASETEEPRVPSRPADGATDAAFYRRACVAAAALTLLHLPWMLTMLTNRLPLTGAIVCVVGLFTCVDAFLRIVGNRDAAVLMPRWIGDLLVRAGIAHVLVFNATHPTCAMRHLFATNLGQVAILPALLVAPLQENGLFGSALLLALRAAILRRDVARGLATAADVRSVDRSTAIGFLGFAIVFFDACDRIPFLLRASPPDPVTKLVAPWAPESPFTSGGAVFAVAVAAGLLVAAYAALRRSRRHWIAAFALCATSWIGLVAYAAARSNGLRDAPQLTKGAALLGAVAALAAVSAALHARRAKPAAAG
jgi:predicted Ser/Thr protein kinase